MIRAQNPIAWLVGILALLGAAFSIRFLLVGGANEQFDLYPNVLKLHVIPGLLYLGLAPLQFSSTVRNRYPVYHRWAGRAVVLTGLVLGWAALFIGIVIPFSGVAEQVVTGGFGLYFLLAITLGFRKARARDFAAHREWMIRALAIGLSIVTMRLIFVPILILIGGPTMEQVKFFSIFSFTIAFVLHAMLAELWIRNSRMNRTLAASG